MIMSRAKEMLVTFVLENEKIYPCLIERERERCYNNSSDSLRSNRRFGFLFSTQV